MARRLSAEEAALWRKVVQSVRPLHDSAPGASAEAVTARSSPPAPPSSEPELRSSRPKASSGRRTVGDSLDSSWERRLSKGLVQPDLVLDLHGHNLATAYDLLDRRLARAIGEGARLLLLITGRPPSTSGSGRGAIRAAVGDWLAASRHSGEIAAVRNAHPRHGGSGALYIILRRRRSAPRG